ncbi:MAG TPA: hypothetical protein VGH89_12175 [Pseudonocardia sp.]|jgi:hypothetical protein
MDTTIVKKVETFRYRPIKRMWGLNIMSTASPEQGDQSYRRGTGRGLPPVSLPVSNPAPEMHARLEHLKRQQQQTSDRMPLAEDVRTVHWDSLP